MFCKQCLHDLQFMKTSTSSPNLSKLASDDIICQFMKTRPLSKWTLLIISFFGHVYVIQFEFVNFLWRRNDIKLKLVFSGSLCQMYKLLTSYGITIHFRNENIVESLICLMKICIIPKKVVVKSTARLCLVRREIETLLWVMFIFIYTIMQEEPSMTSLLVQNVSSIFDKCSSLENLIWLSNHPFHTKIYFNDKRDNMHEHNHFWPLRLWRLLDVKNMSRRTLWFCLPQIQEMISVMTFSLHSASGRISNSRTKPLGCQIYRLRLVRREIETLSWVIFMINDVMETSFIYTIMQEEPIMTSLLFQNVC